VWRGRVFIVLSGIGVGLGSGARRRWLFVMFIVMPFWIRRWLLDVCLVIFLVPVHVILFPVLIHIASLVLNPVVPIRWVKQNNSKPIIIAKIEGVTLLQFNTNKAVIHSYVDEREMNKGLGDVVDTQEMVGNLIASILEGYSTINNVAVKRVKRNAIRGGAFIRARVS
jgi:hypothetical protein